MKLENHSHSHEDSGESEHGSQSPAHNKEVLRCHGESCDVNAPRQTVALNPQARADERTTLRVAGMDCADEVVAIERVLKPMQGVREVKVNLMAGTVTIAHEKSVAAENLVKAIGTAGLKASQTQDPRGMEDDHSAGSRRARFVSVIISGCFTGIALLFQWQSLFAPYGKIAAACVAIASGGWFILPKALRALRQISLDMNVLMAVAVIGAACIGEWTEGAAVVFLFALSELLEGYSVARARRAIESLLELTPATALVKRENVFQELRVEEVKIDETMAVKSGMRVPLDGVVLSGQSAINQAPITGESMPVEKKVGDQVFAGTINGEGALEVKVTKAHTDTTLAKIIQLVGEAQSQKAPSQRFVDRFARYYTPAVFVLAMLVLLVGGFFLGGSWPVWVYRSLVLLVIACPCALVISTPVSIVSGLTAMARRGVLIKGGAVLESVGKLKALAVDKTGTITEGQPRVTKVRPWGDTDESEAVRIAAAIDTHSEHPLAKAVVKYANDKGIQFPRSENYQAKTGRGAEAKIDGHNYFVGNHRFAHELGLCSPELEATLGQIEEQAQSVVVVGHKTHDGHTGELMGILSVGDAIRENAPAAIEALHKSGIIKVVMLSGDNQRTVNGISKQVGIDEAYGDLLPDNKIERVKKLSAKYKYVGMIGDGVNDAPALAAASVGIAMGGAGTDTSIETADMVLMQDDLSQLSGAIQLGRRTVRVIQANIAFALGVKAVFLALALSGHSSLWLAILADTGATLVVIANALRLLHVPRQSTQPMPSNAPSLENETMKPKG